MMMSMKVSMAPQRGVFGQKQSSQPSAKSRMAAIVRATAGIYLNIHCCLNRGCISMSNERFYRFDLFINLCFIVLSQRLKFLRSSNH